MEATRRDRGDESAPVYLAKDEINLGFEPDRTALLVIDPVNDFLSDGGAGWEMTKTTVTMNDVVSNLKRAIGGARARNVPVLFGPMAYTEGTTQKGNCNGGVE
ncbi:MAG: isochorismatase family protein [Candidatus Binatia bacterium]